MKRFKAPPKFHLTIRADPPYTPGMQVVVICNSFQLPGVVTESACNELFVTVQSEPIRFVWHFQRGCFVADVEKQTVDNGSVQAVQTSLF